MSLVWTACRDHSKHLDGQTATSGADYPGADPTCQQRELSNVV